MQGRVLIIAGSDSGGGAGIQADIKVVTALGGYASTAITALTAQNTLGVFGIHEVPLSFIADQIRLVLTDIGADVIKTGMLLDAGVIHTIVETLDQYGPEIPLVVDPVMVAKGGASLLGEQALSALKSMLLSRAALITPNIPEAEFLTGMVIDSAGAMLEAGHVLLASGAEAVLVKGGHLPGETVYDVLLTRQGHHIFEAARIHSRHTHGTGCTLASAIACLLAQKKDIKEAVACARSYVREAIRLAPGLGQGHGPLGVVREREKRASE